MKGQRLRVFAEEILPVMVALVAVVTVLSVPSIARGASDGASVVSSSCVGCHGAGVLGAPKLGDKDAWGPRIKQGEATLLEHALKGFNQMPPRGGNPKLTDAEVKAAVAHMVGLANGTVKQGNEAFEARSARSLARREDKAQVMVADAAAPVKVANNTSKVNTFNRLMRPASKRNPPPPLDGIHDPANEGTNMLQPPREAFSSLQSGIAGNHVDWVKSLAQGDITPRYDRLDPARQPVVLDLNIVREVKGSMPNVVYPHKQHTEWLDCSNCHPAIFIPKKGANNLSMASILLGQQCGVCHGKVAFPVAECRRCHSQNKSSK